MSGNHIRYIGVTGLILVLGAVAACVSTSVADGNRPDPTVALLVTATLVTPTPTPSGAISAPTVSAAAEPDTSGPDNPSEEEVLAQGKQIFEKTAGGVGCAMCHGMDALGDPAQAAPPNIGASAEMIEQALFDRPQMSFISLTVPEVKAVAAYLQWLKEQQ